MSGGFDLNAFRKAKLSTREEDLPLPGLAEAGLGDQEPDPETGKLPPVVFKVRGLTAEELSKAEHEADNSRLMVSVSEKLVGAESEKVQAILDALGLNSATPASLSRKMCHVQYGVVEPELKLQDVVKLADGFPIEFGLLAQKIYELTGKGKIAQVKRKPSGATPASKQA